MPSIIVLNDDGNVIYKNILENVEGLVNIIRDGEDIPGFQSRPPEVRIKGLIVLAEQAPYPKRQGPRLSMMQAQVLRLMAMAYTPVQTARKLGISEPTVRLHIQTLKKKFNTESRDQMMAMAGSLGLCDPFEEKENGKGEGRNY